MIECTVSVASPTYNNAHGYQCKLIIEIANNHLVYLVEYEKKVIGFEYFSIIVNDNNWNSVLETTKNYSKLFTKNFGALEIVYNMPEAIVVPASKFSINSIDCYLQTIFGEQNNYKNFTEKINIQHQPSLVAGININVENALQKHFGNHYNSHVFTRILQQTLGKETMVLEILKVQFYQNSMLVLVINNNELSLIQNYNYNTPEDVVYYLLNIVEQFSLSLSSTPVEVSGLIATNSKTFEMLEHLFTRLSLETVHVEDNSGFENAINVSNAHYYTPFFNLAQ